MPHDDIQPTLDMYMTKSSEPTTIEVTVPQLQET